MAVALSLVDTAQAIRIDSSAFSDCAIHNSSQLLDSNALAQVSAEFPMLAVMEKCQRPTAVANSGNPSDHKAKISYIDMSKDFYVLHDHDEDGGATVTISNGHLGKTDWLIKT